MPGEQPQRAQQTGSRRAIPVCSDLRLLHTGVENGRLTISRTNNWRLTKKWRADRESGSDQNLSDLLFSMTIWVENESGLPSQTPGEKEPQSGLGIYSKYPDTFTNTKRKRPK